MPKIFALRDRLLAVQESLTGNEGELEIFPEKRFKEDPSVPMYNGTITESSTNKSPGETSTPIFGENQQYGCKGLLAQHLGYQCTHDGNENNMQVEKPTADITSSFVVGIEETIRVKCAIEIEKKEGPSSTISEELPIQFSRGKHGHII